MPNAIHLSETSGPSFNKWLMNLYFNVGLDAAKIKIKYNSQNIWFIKNTALNNISIIWMFFNKLILKRKHMSTLRSNPYR